MKFTKTEKSWILYDWANSIYATNMLATLFPILFAMVCEQAGQDNLVLLSYGTSIATFTVAILAPLLGALGDNKGYKKKFFTAFMLIGVIATAYSGFATNYAFMLVGYIFSYIGFSGANVFYDSFLTDVTTTDKMDKVSSWGFAMGYTGGSTLGFIISIVILIVMGMDNPTAYSIVFTFTSVWWLVFSIPMLKNVHQKHYVVANNKQLLASSMKNLKHTVLDIVKNKKMLCFIFAYFFYIDGVNTIITISTSYGSSLGLDSIGMILALLVTQIVAVPCSLIFNKLAEKYNTINLLIFAVSMYIGIAILGFIMGIIIEIDPEMVDVSLILFWILAIWVGTVQGGIQALSRSYFAKLVPPEKSNEYFGFFDIFGKFAAVIGPVLVGSITLITGSSAVSVLSISILFILGLTLLLIGRKKYSL